MPLYEYRCSGCGQVYEQLRRMQDADQGLACPKCQSVEVKRLLSTFASHVASSSASDATAPCGAPAGSCGGGQCNWQ
jgi:putative FmdB family regulatory protein